MHRMKESQTLAKIEMINMYIDSAVNHANEISSKKTQWNEDGYEVSIALGFFVHSFNLFFY